MAAYAWGRGRRANLAAPGPLALPGGGDQPRTLTDDERAAWERLGPVTWWRWANRGRFDPPRPWEQGS